MRSTMPVTGNDFGPGLVTTSTEAVDNIVERSMVFFLSSRFSRKDVLNNIRCIEKELVSVHVALNDGLKKHAFYLKCKTTDRITGYWLHNDALWGLNVWKANEYVFGDLTPPLTLNWDQI